LLTTANKRLLEGRGLLMRLTVVTAAVCLCLVGFSAANPSQASIRKSTNIPAEGLGPALEALAKDRNFQIVYVSEEINDLRTQGAVGELTPEEALKILLSGTGLTYRYLDDKTVTIIPTAQGSGAYAAPAPGGTSSNLEPLPIQLAQAATAPTNPDQPSNADLPRPQSAEPKKDDELAQIVVTGTRISGVGSALTTPIITITHEEILERGYSSVQDVLGTLTMEYSNVNSSSFVASGNVTSPDSNGKGLSAVNLRGLGTGSTLVLIDGQRSANAPTADGAMVDLTKIPVGMIDHIDVITGSASSIYGGDAIAGVINIITRKDYQGAETFVSAANSNSGADGYEIRQLLGTGWGSGNITANFNADHQLPAQTAELGITTQDQVSRGGRDWRDYNFTSPPQLITDGVTPIPGGTSETFSALLPPGNGTNVHPNNLTYISNEDASNMSGNYKLLTPTNDTLERYLTPQ
jgi:iron complex outermembrane recepter protein